MMGASSRREREEGKALALSTDKGSDYHVF